MQNQNTPTDSSKLNESLFFFSFGRSGSHSDEEGRQGLSKDYDAVVEDFKEALGESLDSVEFSLSTSISSEGVSLIEAAAVMNEEIDALTIKLRQVIQVPQNLIDDAKANVTSYAEKYKDSEQLNTSNSGIETSISFGMITVQCEDTGEIIVEITVNVEKENLNSDFTDDPVVEEVLTTFNMLTA